MSRLLLLLLCRQAGRDFGLLLDLQHKADRLASKLLRCCSWLGGLVDVDAELQGLRGGRLLQQ